MENHSIPYTIRRMTAAVLAAVLSVWVLLRFRKEFREKEKQIANDPPAQPVG